MSSRMHIAMVSILVACLSCMHVGCAQLIRLPFFILALPFKILKMVVALLPLAVKYAPLALLFVSRDAAQVDEFKYMLDEAEKTDGGDAIRFCAVSPDIMCYALNLELMTTDKKYLTTVLEKVLADDENARILFVSTRDVFDDTQKCSNIYEHMAGEKIKVGRDMRLNLADSVKNEEDKEIL